MIFSSEFFGCKLYDIGKQASLFKKLCNYYQVILIPICNWTGKHLSENGTSALACWLQIRWLRRSKCNKPQFLCLFITWNLAKANATSSCISTSKGNTWTHHDDFAIITFCRPINLSQKLLTERGHSDFTLQFQNLKTPYWLMHIFQVHFASYKYVVILVNHRATASASNSGEHWMLLVTDMKKKEVYMLNSKTSSSYDRSCNTYTSQWK